MYSGGGGGGGHKIVRVGRHATENLNFSFAMRGRSIQPCIHQYLMLPSHSFTTITPELAPACMLVELTSLDNRIVNRGFTVYVLQYMHSIPPPRQLAAYASDCASCR